MWNTQEEKHKKTKEKQKKQKSKSKSENLWSSGKTVWSAHVKIDENYVVNENKESKRRRGNVAKKNKTRANQTKSIRKVQKENVQEKPIGEREQRYIYDIYHDYRLSHQLWHNLNNLAFFWYTLIETSKEPLRKKEEKQKYI